MIDCFDQVVGICDILSGFVNEIWHIYRNWMNFDIPKFS